MPFKGDRWSHREAIGDGTKIFAGAEVFLVDQKGNRLNQGAAAAGPP